MMAKSVLVLGAYGHVGPWIVSELVKMGCVSHLVATGRKKAMLDARLAGIDSAKLELQTLDAFDVPALRAACNGVDLVINCVGPYAWRGSEITLAVIDQGVNYLDFANEQSHYRKLQAIGVDAERNGLRLVTGVGTSPGVSTMLFQMGKEAVPSAKAFDLFYASGRHPSRAEGFGSTIGAIVETGFNPVAWIGGKQVKMPLGKAYRDITLPKPYGTCHMVSFPTIDSLIVPTMLGADTVNAFWSLGTIPFGLGFLIKIFQPHKCEWAYKQFSKLAHDSMNHDFDRAEKDNLGTESMMLVRVSGEARTWEATMTFPDGGGAAASYMAVLAAKRVLEGSVRKAGLVTPADGIATPAELLKHMRETGWTGNLEANRVP